MSENTLFYLLAAGAIGGMLWVLFLLKFTRYLHDNHPDIYNELGQPSLSIKRYHTPAEISAMFAEIYFIVSGKYKKISDNDLVRFGNRLRLLFIFTSILISASFVAIIQPGLSSEINRAGKSQVVADINKAYDYHKDGHNSEALDILNEVITNHPDNAEAYYYRGYVNEKLKRNIEALSDFEKVVELDPDNFDSYVHIDWHYALERDWQTIVTYWNKYIERNPDDDKAYLERGGTYFRSGKLNLAMQDAKRSCDLGNTEGCKRYDQVKTAVNK